MSASSPRWRRFRRSDQLQEHLTLFLVCGIATVVFTRAFLAATGYPQVGNAKLHIAHVLYGGLLMVAALTSLLAFLSPATKVVAPVVGGIGFGLFIDEVGKFVTKNVNYFYKPAIAIIYVAFLVLFGVVRVLSRRRLGPDEALLIALDSLQHAAVGTLTDERRARTLQLLKETGATGPLAEQVTALVASAGVDNKRPGLAERATIRMRELWTMLTGHRRFRLLVDGVLVVGVAVSIAETGWLLRHGFDHLSGSAKAYTATTIVADLMLIVGAIRLPSSLLSSLHWYDHAVLLQITVGQIFLFSSEQFEAGLNLIALLVLWFLIRWGIHFESARVTKPA